MILMANHMTKFTDGSSKSREGIYIFCDGDIQHCRGTYNFRNSVKSRLSSGDSEHRGLSCRLVLKLVIVLVY